MTARPHTLTAKVETPGVVDDYGNEVVAPELTYTLACPYQPGEQFVDCQCYFECSCQHPEDLPAEHWATDAALDAAMADYEDRHGGYVGYEPQPGVCWASVYGMDDWEPDSPFLEPGVWPVWVENAGHIDDSSLILTPAT